MFCREQAAQLTKIYSTVQQMGVNIVAIGNGTPLMAADFIEQFNIPFPIYTDTARHTYQLMNMHYGLGIGLGTIKAGLGITRKGTRQGKTQGDVWQQGGEALFSKGGKLLWHHANKNAEEHTTPNELLLLLERLKDELH